MTQKLKPIIRGSTYDSVPSTLIGLLTLGLFLITHDLNTMFGGRHERVIEKISHDDFIYGNKVVRNVSMEIYLLDENTT